MVIYIHLHTYIKKHQIYVTFKLYENMYDLYLPGMLCCIYHNLFSWAKQKTSDLMLHSSYMIWVHVLIVTCLVCCAVFQMFLVEPSRQTGLKHYCCTIILCICNILHTSHCYLKLVSSHGCLQSQRLYLLMMDHILCYCWYWNILNSIVCTKI